MQCINIPKNFINTCKKKIIKVNVFPVKIPLATTIATKEHVYDGEICMIYSCSLQTFLEIIVAYLQLLMFFRKGAQRILRLLIVGCQADEVRGILTSLNVVIDRLRQRIRSSFHKRRRLRTTR